MITLDPAARAEVNADSGGFDVRGADGTSYRVDIDSDVLSPANQKLAGYFGDRRVLAFVGPNVDRLYGRRLRAYLDARLPPDSWSVHRIPAGEKHKTLATVEEICATAKAMRLDRQGVMLAVGGGITADLVGFAASMYARGVDYVKVNTTLVGQVDVGVGIKTGVNAYGAKNMLGTYHPALGSLNDPGFLRTLPDRDVRCGLGEIVKMAVIKDRALFDLLAAHPTVFRDVTPDPHLEDRVLRTAMELMLVELCGNLRERSLARLVDFGHTFGPVIEVASGHRVAHGESVAIDMAISSHVARLLGILDPASCRRVVDLLRVLGLPVFDPETCTPDLMLAALHSAWERRGRHVHLVVPDSVGSAVFVDDLKALPESLLTAALDALAADAGNRPMTGVVI
ncbi:sedoheptulose 7-phosphate cyclase [Micromonospora schwarzwaldensis]|uniref:sedoheptulose 7-phosphate cyclase n=1 Tax=Micromonospora sp. DSM 45708 TaxID=3111767 RepID=UPI0031E18599